MTYGHFVSIIKSDVFKRNMHILYKLKEVDINQLRPHLCGLFFYSKYVNTYAHNMGDER